MATDAIITLERLRCNRERDGTGHSEPYIWPVLLWIDDQTLATPQRVGMTTPVLESARVVIKNDMRAGETADIPNPVGLLRVRFEDGSTFRRLFLVVALWEKDGTPEKAMRAGFKAFSSELRAAVADHLPDLIEPTATIINTIRDRVANRVKSAIVDGLTPWQLARLYAKLLNLDDFIDSLFLVPELLSADITTLAFGVGSRNEYEIEGNLQLRDVLVDRCQALVNAVNDALIKVNQIHEAISRLQDELGNGPPIVKKPGIILQIKELEDDLDDAMAALENAQAALQGCRSRIPPPVISDTLVAIARDRAAGNKVGIDEKEIQGFKTKTFFDNSENIEVTIASDGKSTIVAVPKTAISRRNQMGDDEYKCLKACKDIADLERRLNCILLCPVTKQYQVFIF